MSVVPNTFAEPVSSEPPLALAAPPRRSWTWIPKLVALLLALFWLANIGISLLITHTRLQQRITGRLQAVFGRPVEVGRYDFESVGRPDAGSTTGNFCGRPPLRPRVFPARRIGHRATALARLCCAAIWNRHRIADEAQSVIWCAIPRATGISPNGCRAHPSPHFLSSPNPNASRLAGCPFHAPGSRFRPHQFQARR